MEDEKRVGVITEVGFGMRDLNIPCLWFTLRLDTMSSALQVFTDWEDIKRIIQGANVRDVKDLNGKACWYVRKNGLVHFSGTFDDPWD